MSNKLSDIPVTTCACSKCVKMCEERPCWPTPDEAKAIIDAGLGNRLMSDWWADSTTGDIHIISPAISGYEGKGAPFWPTGRCTFLTQDNKCELHDIGLKPIEGRVADCKIEFTENVHELVAKTWDNNEAQQVVQNWEDSTR